MMSISVPAMYYAFGGGLGHLTRARAVRRTLGIDGPFSVLCASAFAADPGTFHDLNPQVPPEGSEADPVLFQNWILERLESFCARTFFVDSFPGGISGELCGTSFPEGVELVHIGRILRWEPYSRVLEGPLPRYSRCLLTETVDPDQERTLLSICDSLHRIDLVDLPACDDRSASRAVASRWAATAKPVWLVVHSGPEEETSELLSYARECAAAEGIHPHFAVASPGPGIPGPDPVERIDLHPVSGLFPFADRIVTACGANTWRQTRPWRDRHLCLPFPRRFDDQFLRRRISGDGRS
jgi:hypothetical protein